MNKIQAAYQKLGVPPGSSLDVAKKRYRQLAMVWHPDRMPTPEGRRTAEEELKQINNAFDSIKKHFESSHRQGQDCECQPSASNQQTGTQNQNNGYGNTDTNGNAGSGPSSSNPGGYQREKTTYEKWAEQEARTEAERRRRAEEAHEAALREALERARKAAETQSAAATVEENMTQPMTEEQLRWRISMALAAIFVFLLIGGFNKRYEPSARPNSEFSLSAKVEHLRPSPFLN